MLGVVPCTVIPHAKTKEQSKRRNLRGQVQGAIPRRLGLQVEALDMRGGFFSSKNELQPREVDRAEVAERENPARMGGGEFDVHTKPDIRRDAK